MLGLAAILMVLASGCDRAPPASPRPALRLAIDLWAGYYPLLIADEKGFLRSAGISVDVVVPGNTKQMAADFAAGKYDGICFSLADAIMLTQVTTDFRMILNTDESAGADVILGRGPITGPESIRGQRIGTSLGGFGELLVRRFLDRHGVRLDEIILVNADAADVPDLLARGELGFGHTWEPYAARAREAGAQEHYSSRHTPGLIVDGLFVQSAALRERPEDIRTLVREWFRALEWWTEHREEGDALIERRLSLPPGTAAPAGIRLLGRAENRRHFHPEAVARSLTSAVNEYAEYFLNRGLLSRRPVATELLDGGFLP